MKKNDINLMPPYFDRYINLVDTDVELTQAFIQSERQLDSLDKKLLTNLNGIKYEEDKWTVKQIFQHLIDWERILSYRALLFARGESSSSPNLDENLLAENMNAARRSIDELIEELRIVRASTAAMFQSFDENALRRTGINWKYEMSVLAMGFTIVGHQLHHFKIIDEKYLPLADESGRK